MASDAPAMARFIVGVDTGDAAAWLASFDFASIGLTPVFIVPADLEWTPTSPVATWRVPCETGAGGSMRPVFGRLADLVAAEDLERCLLCGQGLFSSLIRAAADDRGLPVATIVESRAQLESIGSRTKTSPDLLLLATTASPAEVLTDRRYGSTLVPVGPRPSAADTSASETSTRIVDALDRWRRGALESASPELSVVVPAYKERDNIGLVCERLLEALGSVSAEILIVDDASGDGTYERACEWMWRSPRLRAFTKPPPRGMGYAIRYGIERARAPIVAVTMGDGSDEVAKLPAMLARVRDDGYSLAIGSRYRHRVNYQTVPGLYRFWSAIFRTCARLLVGVRLKDYTNAFRVFDRRIFGRAGPEGTAFEISPEITFKAWFATGRVTEVDVRHLKRASGQSSFSFLRAGPGYGKMLVKAVIRRLTGKWFVVDW